MKRTYHIVLMALSVIVLSWFLPWLYSMLMPDGINDPFVAYSPVSDCFVVSENDDRHRIFAVDSCGMIVADNLTKDQRDSLLPQVYFNQLNARGKMPERIAGDSVSIPMLKQAQWTFASMPRDINKRKAKVHPVMESMPARFELEDPVEVFRFADGIEFVNMVGNRVDKTKSAKFTRVFKDRGFMFPPADLSADITTRKPYDEGYLIVDANGDVYHMKMMAGQPYLAKLEMPGDAVAKHVFIMENPDRRHLGLIADADGHLYAIEKDDCSVVRLPVDCVDTEKQRISIYKTLFNWVVTVRDADCTRWIAFSSDDYTPYGEYRVDHPDSNVEKIAAYIFPYELSFTDINDSYAYPRITGISAKSLYVGFVFAALTTMIAFRRKDTFSETAVSAVLSLILGVFYFIPFIIIKNK